MGTEDTNAEITVPTEAQREWELQLAQWEDDFYEAMEKRFKGEIEEEKEQEYNWWDSIGKGGPQPRHPKGSPQGGEFAPKDGSGANGTRTGGDDAWDAMWGITVTKPAKPTKQSIDSGGSLGGGFGKDFGDDHEGRDPFANRGRAHVSQMRDVALEGPDGQQLHHTKADALVEAWNTHFDKPPRAAVDEFVKGTGLQTGKTLEIKHLGGRNVEYGATLYDKSGNDVGYIKRRFLITDTGQRIVEHSLFTINKDAQGQGIAKKMLANKVKAYDRLGVDVVTMEANIDVGGYAWARYGFVPSTTSWNGMKTKLTAKLESKKFSGLDDATKSKLGAALNSNDRRAIWQIADDRVVGKKLLLKSKWNGQLWLKDKTSMDRFNSYVG